MSLESTEKKGFMIFIKSKMKLIIISIVILFLIGIFFGWLDYKNKKKITKVAENFIEAKIMLSKNNPNKSLKILKEIIDEKEKIYSPLALFLLIDQNLEIDKEKILEYFDIVLSIKNIESEDLNLLKLKKAIFISNTSSESEILALLNPIINSDSVWKAMAIKFVGDYYFSLKEFKKAEEYYSILLENEEFDVDFGEIKRKMKLIKNG